MLNNLNIKVTVDKDKIINALEANKRKHVEDFEKARVVYFKDLQKQLKDLLKKANKEELGKYYVDLHQPQLKEDEYQKMIDMFGLSKEDSFELETETFDSIFNDSWHWIASAKVANMAYSSRY